MAQSRTAPGNIVDRVDEANCTQESMRPMNDIERLQQQREELQNTMQELQNTIRNLEGELLRVYRKFMAYHYGLDFS